MRVSIADERKNEIQKMEVDKEKGEVLVTGPARHILYETPCETLLYSKAELYLLGRARAAVMKQWIRSLHPLLHSLAKPDIPDSFLGFDIGLSHISTFFVVGTGTCLSPVRVLVLLDYLASAKASELVRALLLNNESHNTSSGHCV